MTLDTHVKSVVRALIYPIQFSANPVLEIERVLELLAISNATSGSADTSLKYLAAVTDALNSSEQLSNLIPQYHSEAVIRNYLSEVQKRLEELSKNF